MGAALRRPPPEAQVSLRCLGRMTRIQSIFGGLGSWAPSLKQGRLRGPGDVICALPLGIAATRVIGALTNGTK